jgi:hypothetical protein
MGKRPPRQTFAEVVREVEEAPVTPEPRTGGITDPTGTHWMPINRQISPGHALALAAAGAPVAWDACGCRGYCGFTWFSEAQVAGLVRAGAPTIRHTKRRRGNLSEWGSEDGRALVVAEDAVRWADLLDG